jgi:hypothetical protein
MPRSLTDALSPARGARAERDRQVAASEVLSNMLFAIGDYPQSKQLLAFHSLLISAKDKRH